MSQPPSEQSSDPAALQLAPTLDGKDAVTPRVGTVSALPAALFNWDRYEVKELLGQGGMGVVYKALDRRLNRLVALKFIHMHSVSAETAQRLMREARAQARISHEGVCKVHEVGEVAGQLYIAMEYLPGKPLLAVQRQLTLEEKVYVIKDVAEALHAAHQLGIIHRDIKPANIMVEQKSDGRWQAVVMDFGLARDSNASEKLTETGAVMGTPAYMSPEQAQGEASRLDRRSDVYSLGAMLYELLAGVLPFDGDTVVKLLLQVMHDEAPPLRKKKPTIPVDLEVITMKCLRKEVQHRYESAQALADDLGRYLCGEPIVARQVSWRYRLRQAARRHKFLLSLSILTVLGTGSVFVTWLRAQTIAARQVRTAQQFGQAVTEIELFMRYAYGLPLHNTGIEKQVVRSRMKSIEQGMGHMDGEAAALAYYALGRGHMVLGEFEHALEHLKKAQQGGLRSAETEYALGRTLGEIYNRRFKDLARRSGKQLTVEKQKLDKEFLEPALYHLQQSKGPQRESKPFAEGLIAYYSQNYQQALERAQEALAQEPWIYEAKKLQADVFYAYGFAKQRHGQYQESRSDYHRAAELYHEAAEMARSDSSIHGAEADMWVQVMDIDKTQGFAPKEAFERALAACERAILSNPENASAVRKKLWALIRWADYQSTHGEDPRNIAQQAIDTAQQAVQLNPKNAFSYDQMGIAYLIIARADNAQNQDTSVPAKLAAESFQKAVEVNPAFAWAWNDFGVLHSTQAEWLARRGADYREELSSSVSKFQRAIEADPEYHIAYGNLVDTYRLLARYEMEHGRTPEAWIEKAIEASTRSLQCNPNFYETYRNLASIHTLDAEYQAAIGRSPQASLAKAFQNLSFATKENPNDAETQRELARFHLLSARELLAAHRDATEPLAQGLKAIKRSILINPNYPESSIVQAELLVASAEDGVRHGQPPQALLEQARVSATRAREIDGKLPDSYVSLAEIARARAEWQLAHRQSASAEITEGLSMIDQAVQNNGNHALALSTRGELYLLSARAAAGPARKQAASLASTTLTRALAQNALLKRQLAPLLDEATALGR